MSWAGVLELVQKESAFLLCDPVAQETSAIDRKYLLTISNLVDDEHAQHIVDQRIASEYCANWLCAAKIKSAAAAAAGARVTSTDDSSIEKKQQQQVSSGSSFQRSGPHNRFAASCCTPECAVALFHLLKRASEFDPTSQQVSESIFKLFPNARDNIEQFAELKRQENLERQRQQQHQQNSENSKDNNSNAAARKQQHVSFNAALPGSNSAALRIREKDPKLMSVAAPNTRQHRPIESSSLLFSALDPRIGVVVLTDLLLPSSLRREWTQQLATNFNGSIYSNNNNNNNMSNRWLEALPGGSELVSRCTARAAALSDAATRSHDDDTNNVVSTGSIKSLLLNANTNKAAVIAAHNNFRAKETAADVLNTLVVMESRRAALLLRLDCELPMEVGAVLHDLTTRRFMCPAPLPYEDSKDTWLLFILFLYSVLSLTDVSIATRLGERPPKAISSDIFAAFCLEPASTKDILFGFFELDD